MAALLAGELVGRTDSLDAVRQAVERARRGTGCFLALVGEPGVGKSRLAREAVATAEAHGLGSFVGRSVAGEVLLGPLVTAFVSCGRGRPFPKAPELAAFRRALGHLVPDWAEPTLEPLPPERVAPLLAEAVLRLVRATAPRGALLVVEDLHAADRDTLMVLDHLGDALESSGLSVLVTLRPGSPTSDRWLAGAVGRRTVSAIGLDPLDPSETSRLVSACLGGPPPARLVEHVVEHSDGIPLLVEDLLAALVSAGVLGRREGRWTLLRPLVVGVPRTFAETVEARMRTLPAAAVNLLRGAAVLGRRFDWRMLPDIVGDEPAAVLEHLRAAVSCQLVTPVADTVDEFGFRHALTREVVLGTLLPPERVDLAARAAAVVDRHDGGDDQLLLAAALHAQAGEPVRAAERLLDLGRRLLGRGALDAAADALARARSSAADAALADRVDRALLEVHAAAGRVDQAFEIGEHLLRRATGDMTEVHLCLARAAAAAGERDRAIRHLDAIAAGSLEHVRGTILRAGLAVSDRDPVAAEPLARRALALARAHGDTEALCEAVQVVGRAVRLRSAQEAQTWFEEGRVEAERGALPLWEVRALHELGTIDLIESGRTDRLGAARRSARSLGMYEAVGHIDLHLGILHAHRGDHRQAEARLRSALALGRSLRLHGLRRIATAQLGYALALAGRVDDADEHIADVVAGGGVDDAVRIATGLAAPLAHLLREDRVSAVSSVDEAVRSSSDPSWPQWGLRALLHAVEGDHDPAEELDSAVPAPERGRLQHAYLLFALAVVRGRSGDAPGAQATVAAAQEQLGWQVAHRRFCLRQLGEAAVRDGWGEPVAWLTSALHDFRGVAPVASACRQLIRAAGGTVPRVGRGDSLVPESLGALGVTSREMDVLKLVVAGGTNEQIAARLHLSKRTVEGHVANLLAKTGAENRVALARFANPVLSSP